MVDITIFLITFFLLQAVCLWVGRRASKSMNSQDDYFLAGRSIRFFPLMMTLVATQIGGGLVLGSAEEAYKYGWIVLLYPLGATLGLMALACGIGKRMSRFQVSTVAALFEVVYGSLKLKKIASFLSIFSLFFILVAQVIASKKFMLSLGVDNQTIFLLFWGIVIVYTVMGGLKAVVATDIIQAIFFITIFFLSFIYCYFFSTFEFTPVQMEAFQFDASKCTGWLLMPLLFMVIEQDMAQRCFAAKSGKVVSLASGVAAVTTIIVCLIPVFFGVAAKSSGVEVKEGSSVLMAVVGATTTPFIAALVGCAILVAIISTADSLINAISSNVASDFGKVKSVTQARIITTLISLSALFVSFSFHNVVDLLILSYELSVSALFVPIFMALFIRKGNPLSAVMAIVLGTTGFLLFHLVQAPIFPREIDSLILSGMGYGLTELSLASGLVRSSLR